MVVVVMWVVRVVVVGGHHGVDVRVVRVDAAGAVVVGAAVVGASVAHR